LAPADRLFDLSVPNAIDCIDRIQITPAPKSKQPRAPIEKFDLRGDFIAGLRTVRLTTGAGEKEYRVSCPDQNNRALPIGVAQQKSQ
jgi:hypothetical protein